MLGIVIPGRDPLQQVFDARDLRPVRAWLTRAPAGLSVTAGEAEASVETHYDTPDWRFHGAGLALSIRRAGADLRALAVPFGDSRLPGAAESIAADDDQALSACPGPVGERVRCLTGGTTLERRFEVRSHRHGFRVSSGNEILARVVLDEIAIPLGARDEPVRLNRIEISTEGAVTSLLTEWIDSLCASFGLQPAVPCRYTAALLALGLTPPSDREIGSTMEEPGSSVAETAFVAIRRQFRECLAHDPGTRLGEDIEELHDMRVSTRRMRAAIKLYQAYLPQRLLALQKDLSWLGSALGEVRDLDVQRAQLDTWRRELDEADRAALDALAEIVGRQWIAARRRMLRALGSARFAKWVDRMTTVLARGPARTSRLARLPILAVAPDLIDRHYRRVIKPGKAIERDSPERLYHGLRKRCKALRYALEFHRSLYGSRARSLVRRLVALQDLLGEHQDAAVASKNLRALVGRHGRRLPPETLFVAGVLAERYSRRAKELRARYPKVFTRLRGRRWSHLVRTMEAARPAAARTASPQHRGLPSGDTPRADTAPAEPAAADRVETEDGTR